jgi:hypothetical protein
MNSTQQAAAVELLRAGLSEAGYSKTETIRKLELVLLDIERGSGPVRDPDLYYFTVFGTPSNDGVWGWRYEGHHCSQNWTFVNGNPVSSSPQFFGANPAEVRSGPMKGTRVLAPEEDLGRLLVLSLDRGQREHGILSADAPPDIISGVGRQAAILEERGIAYAALTHGQQKNLVALIEQYASALPQAAAQQRMARIQEAGMDQVLFGWMGGLEPGEGQYYRIQGKSFLIEYDNTQNEANHIHTVWRDYQGDFGLDVLAEHYRASRHGV